jgi:hypothetical protein
MNERFVMVRVKVIVSLLAAAIVIAFMAIAYCMPLVHAAIQALNSEDADLRAAPIILVYTEAELGGSTVDYQSPNPIIHTDKENIILKIRIFMSWEVYDVKLQTSEVNNLGGYLTSVSYKADWQNDQTVYLYNKT